MYYPREFIEEVRLRSDIVEVISDHVRLQKKGGSYIGLCPFHHEKTPSFSVNADKQMYHCFGCGAGGSVVNFIMDYENCSFLEAVEFLANRAGMTLPRAVYSKGEKEKADMRTLLLEVNKQAAKYFYAQLKAPQGRTSYAYLRERGVSDGTITAFGLGYSGKRGEGLYDYLKAKGYADEALMKAGLISVDERKGARGKFWNRVMFPIMDANKRVIGFGGRVMGEGTPKYLNSPETPIFDKSRSLYGLHRAKASGKPYFLVCEGYMDVIALHQAGFYSAVASLGTAFTAGHAYLMKRYVKEAYLIYDSDEAGVRAALRALPILKEAGLEGKVVSTKPYKDPDEFIKNLGAEAFEERLKEAENGFMFTLSALEGEYELSSPEGKTAFLKEAARKLLQFSEEIERTNYIEAVAKAYRVSAKELKALVRNTAKFESGVLPAKRPKVSLGGRGKEKEEAGLKEQRILFTYLERYGRELYLQIKDYITPEDFSKGLYRRAAKLLYQQYEEGEEGGFSKVLDCFTDDDEQNTVRSLFHEMPEGIDDMPERKEQVLKDSIWKIKTESFERKRLDIGKGDKEELQKWIDEKSALEKFKEKGGLKGLHISIN